MSEPKTLHLVFNRPPTGLSDEEFNRWALMHFEEVLAVPGWESARRFSLDADVVPDPAIPFAYMSLYELSGHPGSAVSEMHKARYDHPEWFRRAQAEGCFASWTCVPIGGEVRAPHR